MNEDENGVTPPDVTAITVEPMLTGGWLVVIEQGNGVVVKTIELTPMEHAQLGCILSGPTTSAAAAHVEFIDVTRKVPV